MSVSDDDSREPEVGSASYCIRKRPKHYLGPNLSSPEIPIMLLRQALWLASDSARCGKCTKVEVARAGRTIAVYYDAGLPTDEPDGTQIEFRLDRKLLQGNVYLDFDLVRAELAKLSPAFPEFEIRFDDGDRGASAPAYLPHGCCESRIRRQTSRKVEGRPARLSSLPHFNSL